jgi:hypothetical protein
MKKRSETQDDVDGEGAEERKFRATSIKTEQQLLRAYNWVKTFEDKIMQILEPESADLKKLGGRLVEDAINEELANFVNQEDDHKYRCKVPDCVKLFKEEHFWKKHVEKRHKEWLDGMKQEVGHCPILMPAPWHIEQ